ncbi:putative Tip elongation aberrant protein 1 [Blattamonas nauphoetae]|uniref:Tip elongation aberrant protein 1 n=1 Tax=Blattamonas nauphoetae TaxID=2049346 RepID=A0ABQ9X2B1_9EUKA|nr:putative Tip elongation aberrant protein 1 [Blattamonas nauphoetae]
MFEIVLSLLCCVHCEIGHVTDAWDSYPKTGTPPSPRSKAVAIDLHSVPGFEHTILVFGGQNARGDILKDIFIFNTKIQKWSPFVVNGMTATPGVVDACTYLIGSTVYLWGGTGENGFYNDMWKLDVNTHIWSSVHQSGDIPTARQAAHFAKTTSSLFISGGRTEDGKTNDVHKFNIEKQTWSKVIGETEPGEGNENPPTRSNGGAYADEKYFFLFGGYTSKGDQSFSVYRIDHTTTNPKWKKVPYSTPTEPSAREGSGWCMNGRIVACFGGYMFENGKQEYRNDAVFLDFTNAAAGTNPTVSYTKVDFPADAFLDEALATLDEETLLDTDVVSNRYQRYSGALATTSTVDTYFLFGGLTDTLVDGDTIIVTPNAAQDKFRLVSTPIPSIPSPRSGHKSVMALGRMWVFGGREGTNGQLLNDLYSFDVQTHSWEAHTNPTSPSPPAREQYSIAEHSGRLIIFGGKGTNALIGEVSGQNDLWQYSINENKWEQISVLGGTKPHGRYGSAMVCVHKKLFVFGGRLDDTKVTNELWSFSLVTRTWTKMELRYTSALSASINRFGANFTSLFAKPSRYLSRASSRLVSKKNTQDNAQYVPAGREDAFIFVEEGKDRDFLVIGGGVTQSLASILTIDKFVIPKDNDESPIVKYSNPPKLDLSKYDNLPIYYKAYTVAVDDGFVSFGGLDVDNAKSRLNYWKVSDFSNIRYLYDENKNDEIDFKFPFISGGSAVLAGRELFVFGGNIVGKKLPSNSQFHNQMFRFELTKNEFSCSPGTFTSSSTLSAVGCELCPVGQFNEKWGNTGCTKCLPGSSNPWKGGRKGYHCISCQNGQYNDEEGKGECVRCSDSEYCPIGSTSNTNTRPQLPQSAFQQPPRFQTFDHLSTVWTVVPYAGGVAVGAVIALVFLCCPCTRHQMWKWDYFFVSDHTDEIDAITHSSPKMLRKTVLGGVLSVVYVCFVVGTVTTLGFEFFRNNLTETRTLITGAMTTALDSSAIETELAEFSLDLMDFNGKCTADNAIGKEGDCQDVKVESTNLVVKHGDKSFPLNTTCLPTESKNKFRDNSINCRIRSTSPNTIVQFGDDGSFPSIEYTITSDSALCYGMMAQVKLDTGIDFGEKERNASLSSMTLLQLDSKGRVFKGAESTDFEFTIMPSLYTDKKERQHPGYFVAAAHPKEGSKSLPDELFMQFGIKARINLTKAVNVVLTDRVMRQKLPSFVSNCLSAVGGFLGTFAVVLKGVERGHAERAADRAVACGFVMVGHCVRCVDLASHKLSTHQHHPSPFSSPE